MKSEGESMVEALASGLKWFGVAGLLLVVAPVSGIAQEEFHLQEATIRDIHRAIQGGQITCQGLVQANINRARAYNGVCTELVTKDGAPIPSATGAVRAGVPTTFPTNTVPASKILPDLNQYVGPPLEFGRMEPTISDPKVQHSLACGSASPTPGS